MSTHFAPVVETTIFTWAPPPGRKIDAVRLEISDRRDTLVARKTLDDPSVRRFEWDGEDIEAAPVVGPDGAVKQYVNPLRSPFKVKVTARLSDAAPPLPPPEGVSTGPQTDMLPCGLPRKRRPPPNPPTEETAECSVKVLYREVKLTAMTWVDAYKAVSKQGGDAYPAGATDEIKKMWVQYRLNELGYPAGPIQDPTVESPIERALFRYALAHPDLPHIHDFGTLDGWTWEDAWNAEFGDLDELLTGAKASGTKLLDALKAKEQPRDDVIEKPAALADPEEASRIVLDHDIYYINKNFSAADGHADYDEELFNPITIPFKLQVLLVGKADATATGAGVASPRALGAVPIDWTVFDPPEDVSMVPTPTKANTPYRSQARPYLRKVQQDLAPDPDDPLDAGDNCLRSHGGARGSYRDMTGYIRAMDNVSTATADLRKALTKANVDVTNPHGLLGLTAVFFTGSYVAGDNYVLQPRLSFDGVDGGDAIKADHVALPGLKDAFGPRKRWMKDEPANPMAAQTGVLTIWRRNHIARELLWGPSSLPPINWFPIIDNFRAAHTILVPPKDDPIQVADLFDGPTRAEIARAIVESAEVTGETKKEFDARKAQATCRNDGMYPLALRTMRDFEASPLQNGPVPGTSAERFTNYAKYLTDQNQTWPTYSSMVDVARALRKALDKIKAGPGVAVLRAQYMPEPTWAALLPPPVLAATADAQASFKFVKAMATGMDYGVVFLDSLNGKTYADIFFVTHEISHCMFGSHAFEPASTADHDRSDSNCIMYYNSKNDGLSYGWAVRSVPSTYKVAITLKRPPNTPGAVPDSYGRLDGDFTRKDTKNYEFEGSAEEIQAALRGLKYKPESSLGDDYRVSLELNGSGVEPLLSPNALPYKKKVRVGDGTVKPFADATVKPVDLRACEPRFCGKCLLKLRGWRVRGNDQVGHAAVTPLAERSPVIPVNPTMTFEGYIMKAGSYVSAVSGADVLIPLNEGETDPLDRKIKLGPYAFLHKHKLTWESSNGRMSSLSTVRTREWVKFRAPTQDTPFCEFADPDQEFTQQGSNGDNGTAEDDHSVGWPALVVASPLQVGTLIGEQWYQYSLDGQEWLNIEGAAFLLEKAVFFNGSQWLLKFKKSNWTPHNTKPFLFEVAYKIEMKPRSLPKIVVNGQRGLPGAPFRSGGSVITQSGPRTSIRSGGAATPVTLEELQRKGFIASKPWE